MTGDEDSGVEAIGGDVVPFFLDTGIVPSLLGFEAKKYSLPSKGRVYASIISFTTSPLVILSKGVTTSTRLQNRT